MNFRASSLVRDRGSLRMETRKARRWNGMEPARFPHDAFRGRPRRPVVEAEGTETVLVLGVPVSSATRAERRLAAVARPAASCVSNTSTKAISWSTLVTIRRCPARGGIELRVNLGIRVLSLDDVRCSCWVEGADQGSNRTRYCTGLRCSCCRLNAGMKLTRGCAVSTSLTR